MFAVKLLITTAFERFESLARARGQCPNLTKFLTELEAETDLPREQWLDAVIEGLVSIQVELEQQSGRTIDRQQLLLANPMYTTSLESAFQALEVSRVLDSGLPNFQLAIKDQWSASSWQQPGTTIGVYTLESQIGEGGMGAVWRASQESPVRRQVAIKLIKPNIDCRRVVARFELERQTLAIMDHPHIAKVLEAGATEQGQPYFVMELVDGIPIHHYCDKNRLTVTQRMELFVSLCHAVQHAHQKGIIHRDLKPSNVLVSLRDGDHLPKVIDFGLAKALRETDGILQATSFTELGQVVGTFQYMSPEQARSNVLDVDTRSDVYSLGVMLFELLTGSTPIQREAWQEKTILSALEAVRDHEPPRPSQRLLELDSSMLSQVATRRQIEPRKLLSMLSGELDWIVMKSLEKDRERRYQSASSFAQDVRSYLDGECVAARPPSWSYQLGKLWRKQKIIITTTCTVFLVLIASLLITTQLLLATRAAQVAADNALVDSQKKSQELIAEKQKTEQALMRSLISESDLLSRQQENCGWTWRAMEKARDALALLPDGPDSSTLRSLILKCESALDARLIRKLGGPTWVDISFSPDGKYLAAGQAKDNYAVELRIYDTNSWQVHKSLKIVDVFVERFSRAWDGKKSQEGIQTLAYSPDGRWLMAGTRQGKIFIWDVQHDYAGPLSWNAYAKGRVGQAVFTTDGSKLVTASNTDEDFACRAWEWRDEKWQPCSTSLPTKVVSFLTTNPAYIGAISPEKLFWFDSATLEPVEAPRAFGSTKQAYSNSGRMIASLNKQTIEIDAPWTGGRHSRSDAVISELTIPKGITFSPNDQQLLIHSASECLTLVQSIRQPSAAIKIPTAGRWQPLAEFSSHHSQVVATAAEGLEVHEVRQLPNYLTRLAAEGLAEIQDVQLNHDQLWLVGLLSAPAAETYQIRHYELPGLKLKRVANIRAKKSFSPPRFVPVSDDQPVEVLIPNQAWLKFNGENVECLWPHKPRLSTEYFESSGQKLPITSIDLIEYPAKFPDWLQGTRYIHRTDAKGFMTFVSKTPDQDSELVHSYDGISNEPKHVWDNTLVDRMTGNAVLISPTVSGELVLCGGKDALVRLFNHQASLLATAPFGRNIHTALAVRDECFAVGSIQGGIAIGTLPDLKVRCLWNAHPKRISDIVLLRDDRCITCTSDEVNLWSISPEPTLLLSLPLHGARTGRLVACAQGNRCVLTLKECPEIEIWNIDLLADSLKLPNP